MQPTNKLTNHQRPTGKHKKFHHQQKVFFPICKLTIAGGVPKNVKFMSFALMHLNSTYETNFTLGPDEKYPC